MTPARRVTTALGIVVGVAAGVRIAGILLRPPWHDEYFTAWAAVLPLGDLVGALRLDSGPPLPYLLARLLAALGPPPLLAARLVSVLAGTLAVLLAARAGRRAAGAEAGLWCGALLALHPLALAWSCEGRAYALLLLAAALAWERLEALRESGRGAVGLALAIAIACWSHALGLVLAGAAAVTAFLLPRRGRQAALLGVGAGLASHLPWLPVALAQPAGATAWLGASWLALPALERALAPVRLLPAAAPFGAYLDLPSAPLAAQALAAALCALLLFGAARAPRPRPGDLPLPPNRDDGGERDRSSGRPSGLLLAASLAALPAIALCASTWAGAPYLFPGRSESLYLAPLLGLLAAGAAATRPRRLAAALLVVAAAATTVAAVAAWQRTPPSPEASIAATLRRHLPAGGTVVIGGYWRLGVGYHLGAGAARYVLVSVPSSATFHPGWYVDARDPRAEAEIDELAARLSGPGTAGLSVAVLLTPGLATAPPLVALARRLGLREVLRLPAARLWAPAIQGTE